MLSLNPADSANYLSSNSFWRSSMKVKIIENDKDFLSLKNDWNKLSINLPNNFNWLYKWWWYYKRNNELKILVAEENSEVIGIAPLYIQNTTIFRYFHYRKLQLLGGLTSCNFDFLIKDTENRENIFKYFINYIFTNFKFDIFEFSRINTNCKNFELWAKYSLHYDLYFKELMFYRKINLNKFKSYEEYYRSLNNDLKEVITLAAKKIKRERLKVEYVFSKEISENDFKVITNINIKNQNYLLDKGITPEFHNYSDVRSKNFLKEYFCLDNSGSSIMAYMKINGRIIAYLLLLKNNDSIYVCNGGFLDQYKEYSPFNLLINAQIKYAFQHSFKYFDFMEGNEEYKEQWSNDASKIYTLNKNKSFKSRIISIAQAMPPVLQFRKNHFEEDLMESDDLYKI